MTYSMPKTHILLAILIALSLSACKAAQSEPTPDNQARYLPNDQLSIDVIASNLEAPWDIAFTVDDRVFITERDRGILSELKDGELKKIREFAIDNTSEAGLLGVVASPDFASDQRLFIYLTSADDNRVISLSLNEPQKTQEIITGIPKAAIHNGGRLIFGPDKKLYIGTGDANNKPSSQDQSSLAGKILRLNPDGSIPDDNPFKDSPVYAYGFRNVQGLAFGPHDQLYAAEFGPNKDDEINLVLPGKNYGWPHVTGQAKRDEFEDPLIVRQPPEASWSGLTYLHDGTIKEWEGDLFAAALRGQRIWRLTLSEDGKTITDHETLFTKTWGRLRLITQAPDGSLWIITNNRDGRGDPKKGDDHIYRIHLSN